MMNIFQSLFLSFLLTLALELPVFILWGGRGKKDLLLLVPGKPADQSRNGRPLSVSPVRPAPSGLFLCSCCWRSRLFWQNPVCTGNMAGSSGIPFLLSLTANSFFLRHRSDASKYSSYILTGGVYEKEKKLPANPIIILIAAVYRCSGRRRRDF